jgi:hypothetical protein
MGASQTAGEWDLPDAFAWIISVHAEGLWKWKPEDSVRYE